MTRRIMDCLNRQVEDAKENWARGAYNHSNAQEAHRVNMEVTTRVDTLRGLMEMSYGDLKEMEGN